MWFMLLNRWLPRAGVFAVLTGGSSAVWASPPMSSGELAEQLASRRKAFDRCELEFEWYQCNALIKCDPFDSSKWGVDERALGFRYTARLLRPDYHLRFVGPAKSQQAGVERAWVNGVYISKGMDDNGTWHVIRNRSWFSTTGPLPVITALEMWQTCDLREGLYEIASRGNLVPVRRRDGMLVAQADDVLPPPQNWQLTVEFDERNNYVPVDIQLGLRVPGGRIQWHMKATDFATLNGVTIIARAVFAMSNSANSPNEWQIYQYKLLAARPVPTLTVQDLLPEIPSRNVVLLDDVDLVMRRVDQDGRLLEEQRWTPEERQRQLDGIREAVALRQEAADRVARRRSAAWIIAGAAALATLVAGILVRKGRAA